MKITLDPHRDIVITQATVPNGDNVHHMRVVLDGSISGEVYSFLWTTTSSENEPDVWQEHWRGNASACLRNFSEVVEDMVTEALSTLAAEVNAR